MAIAGSREKAKEALRTRIVEAARDIVSEEGLDALSMRALAERIEYSPATIYLYFRDKEELLRDVVEQGFRRMSATVQEQTAALPGDARAGHGSSRRWSAACRNRVRWIVVRVRRMSATGSYGSFSID